VHGSGGGRYEESEMPQRGGLEIDYTMTKPTCKATARHIRGCVRVDVGGLSRRKGGVTGNQTDTGDFKQPARTGEWTMRGNKEEGGNPATEKIGR